MKKRWRRWRVVLRKALRRVVYSRSSSQSIAAGASVGVFVGLTPTVGFQMIIAALAATVLRVNRLAAVFPVWITNPFTIVPVYFFEYQVGAWIWRAEGGPHVIKRLQALGATISAVTVSDLWNTMGAVFAGIGRLGAEILVPLMLGSLIVGSVCAAVAYPLTLWTVVRIRRQREKYAVRKAERRIATLKAAGLFSTPEDDAPPRPSGQAAHPKEPDLRRPADGEPDTPADAESPHGNGTRPWEVVPRTSRSDDPPSRATGA